MTPRRSLIMIGHVLFGVGLLIFSSPFYLGRVGAELRNLPLPLSDAQSVDQGPLGEFFVGDNALGRIQVYDSLGHFLRGWPVPGTYGKALVVQVKSDTVLVLTVHRQRVRFDTAGRVIAIDPTTDYPVNLPPDRSHPGFVLSGTAVTRVDAKGETFLATLEDPYWFLSIVNGWVLCVIGTLVRLGAKKFVAEDLGSSTVPD